MLLGQPGLFPASDKANRLAPDQQVQPVKSKKQHDVSFAGNLPSYLPVCSGSSSQCSTMLFQNVRDAGLEQLWWHKKTESTEI